MLHKNGFRHLELKTEELTARGDVALEMGTWASHGQMPDGKPWNAEGKYLVAVEFHAAC